MWPASALRLEKGTGLAKPLFTPTGDQFSPHPDLSLIRGEWYFTEPTCRTIAELCTGATLLAGTPTVAQLLPGSTLVDSSPWAQLRVDLTQVEHLSIDFEDYWTHERFDSVVLDPPWYFPALTNWINNATYFSTAGSLILFPLFGEGTRPHANIEREQILAACGQFGTVEVIRDAIEYETPRFEVEALKASGIDLRGPWRLSDLVCLRVEGTAQHLLSIRETSDWSEIRVGSTLVAYRPSQEEPPSRNSSLIAHVPGVSDWVLDSVSRRDPRWRFINVWCSNNRVGHVRDVAALRGAVRHLSMGDHMAEDPSSDACIRQVLAWMEE